MVIQITATVDVSSFEAGVRRAEAAVTRAAEQGVLEAAHHVLGVSIPLVPVDEGHLVNSGTVEAKGLEAVIGYGKGASRQYAVRQHEDHSLRHPNGGQANFLGEPVVSEAGRVAQIIARRISGVL